jgi:tripartite-type tricarboxylate transporter receptor subunit TctC
MSGVAAAALWRTDASAQEPWAPSRTVTIVVPYPAGGPTDVVARLVARELQTALGQSVVVENQAGASGSVGTRRVARAEADGHTLVVSTNQTHATNISLLKDGGGYDPVRDFAALGGLADLQHILVVRPDLAARSVPELIGVAKGGTKLTCASTGIGAASHLTMELFKAKTGVDFVHVPYRGSAPLLQDMIGGRVDVSFATVPTVLGQVQGGQLRALAVASPMPSPHLPELPILSSVGVAGVEADAWIAIFAPAGIAPPVRSRYGRELAALMAKPEVQTAIRQQGATVNWREPDTFAAFQRADVQRWADIIKAAGVSVE